MMKSDHWIVISKILWEQRKFWVLSKTQDDKLQICKVQRWEIPFPAKSKEESFALGKEIQRDKRKKGYQDIRREHT